MGYMTTSAFVVDRWDRDMLRNALRRRGRDDDADDDLKDPLGVLLSRAGRGDQSAFAELYDALAPLLHGIVLKVVRDPCAERRGDAGGVRRTVAAGASLRRHHAARSDHGPRRWPTAGPSTGSGPSSPARDRTEREAHKRPIQSNDVAEQVVANIDGTRVRKALERLTEIQRQAVELAYFGGHSYREVALLLDVAEGTIKTRIRDGMIRLRDELGVAT